MAVNRQFNVAVVGATGVAGQQFVEALKGHPFFKITAVAASPRSAGKSYADALREPNGASRWYGEESPDAEVLQLTVQDAASLDPESVDVIFTAIESDAARELEPRLALHRPVFSTASAYRYEPDVPIIVPGVNLEQLAILDQQRKNRGWKGFVVPLPNCTTVGLVVPLKPLLDAFGLKRVCVTSMQGLSGAGRSPGTPAMDVIDNVIPFISGEEEKVAKETGKILGVIEGGQFVPHGVPVAATCTRANVLEGHTEAVQLELEKDASEDEVRAALENHGRDFCARGLPSAPDRLIRVHTDPYRPQPRLDRDAGGGMTTSVGRLRVDENGVRFMLVSHNTKMGAAKGAVLAAEHMADLGTL